MGDIYEFIELHGVGIILVAAAFSFIKMLSNIVAILRFKNGNKWITIVKDIALEIPIMIISLLLASFAGYFAEAYLEDNSKPEFWAYGWTGLAGILGSNIINSLIKLNFDKTQGIVDRSLSNKKD